MPIREVCLSLNDVEEMILGFERKYGLSSPEFFGNQEVKQQLPEDDVRPDKENQELLAA
jgi:hypothetical protein